MSFKIIQACDSSHYHDFITVLESYSAGPMGLSQGLPEKVKQSLITDLPQMPQCLIFLGYHNDSIAGGALCFEVYSTFLGRKALNIHDLAVIPSFRGQGLGRLLLQAVENYARTSNMGRLTLEVRQDNEVARKLYHSLGYSGGEAPMDFWVKKM